MDMDPLTQREAEKIESVLHDLISDLELVSYLPEEFNSWTRDDVVNTTEKVRHLLFSADDPMGHVEESSHDMLTGDEEEQQLLAKMGGFVHAASCFGDPADCEGNEALLQVAEYNDRERELLEAATTVGRVDPDDLEYGHLLLRALLDTLRTGGYTSQVKRYLQKYYPARWRSSSMDSSTTSTEDRSYTLACDEYDKAKACSSGAVMEGIAHLQNLIEILTRLMHLRNSSTVSDDRRRYNILRDAVNKEQSATADVQALNREFEEVKEARAREVGALDREIERLEEELRYVQVAGDVELDAFREVRHQIEACHISAYQQRIQDNREAMEAVRSQLESTQAQNMEAVNQLRSLRTKKEAVVSGAITEYDTQMQTMGAVIDALQKETEEETEQIVRLEEDLTHLQTGHHEYELEKRITEQRQEHWEAIRQRLEQNARVVQAYYRAYAARLHAEREMSKKKKPKRRRVKT